MRRSKTFVRTEMGRCARLWLVPPHQLINVESAVVMEITQALMASWSVTSPIAKWTCLQIFFFPISLIIYQASCYKTHNLCSRDLSSEGAPPLYLWNKSLSFKNLRAFSTRCVRMSACLQNARRWAHCGWMNHPWPTGSRGWSPSDKYECSNYTILSKRNI